jgi:hypothetical protein
LLEETDYQKKLARRYHFNHLILQFHIRSFSCQESIKNWQAEFQVSIKQRLTASKGFFCCTSIRQNPKFVESNGQINSRPKHSPESVISSKQAKERWARPDSNRRLPPCQGSMYTRQYLNRLYDHLSPYSCIET